MLRRPSAGSSCMMTGWRKPKSAAAAFRLVWEKILKVCNSRGNYVSCCEPLVSTHGREFLPTIKLQVGVPFSCHMSQWMTEGLWNSPPITTLHILPMIMAGVDPAPESGHNFSNVKLAPYCLLPHMRPEQPDSFKEARGQLCTKCNN